MIRPEIWNTKNVEQFSFSKNIQTPSKIGFAGNLLQRQTNERYHPVMYYKQRNNF